MKTKFKKIIILAVAVITLASCKKDLGNYELTEINETSIKGIDATYTISTGMSPNIKPILSFTKDQSNDTSKYTYKWVVLVGSTLLQVQKTIHTGMVLDIPINLVSENYSAYFAVTEKSTGIQWRKTFRLSVVTGINNGWLILNDIDGAARLDFMNRDLTTGEYTMMKDVLATQSTLKLKGKPEFVYYAVRRARTDIYAGTPSLIRTIFVGTDKETQLINTQANSFSEYSNLDLAVVGNNSVNYRATRVRSIGPGGPSRAFYYFIFITDTDNSLSYEVHASNAIWGYPSNLLANGQRVKMSPFWAESYGASTGYILMYDVENKRFVKYENNTTSSAVPQVPLGGTQLFDPGNVGMDLVWMDSTPANGGKFYALLKASNGKLWLARMTCRPLGTYVQDSFEDVSALPGIATADKFTIDAAEGYFTYASGAKIYQYDPFNKITNLMKDYGSRKISVMKYHKTVYAFLNPVNIEIEKKLIVGTYDQAAPNTSGTMDMYTVPNFNQPWTIFQSYTGFGKIVDVSYRETP